MSWQTAILPATGPDSKPILSVLAKRTYDIKPGRISTAAVQAGLNQADIPADPESPFYSENLAESDYVGFKPNTDIVVLAKACAPRGKKAFHLECEVHVGSVHKMIRVYGDRKLESKALRGLLLSDPTPFEEHDIGYSWAYGGLAKSKDGTLYSYPPNPLGKGFAIKGGFEDVSEILVPHCEDPSSPIEPESMIAAKYEDWPMAPKPVSFGWTRQHFYPRYTYAGVLPETLAGAMQGSTAPIDRQPRMDPRFFQGASEGLCDRVLVGNEPVRLVFLDPDVPTFEFVLPGERPAMEIRLGTQAVAVEPVLHTLLIDKKENRVAMVWRGSAAYGGIESLRDEGFSYSVE